jgi:pilus assembly protein CpaC
VLFAVIGAKTAQAQAPAPPALTPAAGLPAAGGPSGVVEPLTETVWLAPGQSKVIQAPWPAIRISITDPSVADVKTLDPNQVLLIGKAVGTTDLLMWNKEGQVLRTKVQVMVADLEVLGNELHKLFPDSTLELTPSGRAVVLTGVLARTDQVAQLHAFFDVRKLDYVDMTRVPGVQQVQIKVRVAEVSRMAIRALGLNALFLGSDFQGASLVGADGSGPINPFGTVPTSTIPVSPAVTVFGRFPNADLSLFLQALAENQYLRVLAEPDLTALSGEKASFLAGGEFPIPVVQSVTGGTNGAVTIEYKEFGVRLLFQPVVLGENRIRMYVAPEVSDTTLELSSGQTFAMAGLLQRSSNGRTSRIPGIGDIPVLGALFRSTRYEEGETELVVLVTASLVEPVSTSASTFVLPGEMHAVPNDWEFYALGRVEGKGHPGISAEQAKWLDDTGLDQLRGPGAWASCCASVSGEHAADSNKDTAAAAAPMMTPQSTGTAAPAEPKVVPEGQATPPAGQTVHNAADVAPAAEAAKGGESNSQAPKASGASN